MLIKKIFVINPIIVKELRSRMRGPRPFITLTIMLILLAGITYGIYRISLTSLSSYTGSPFSPQIGQTLFVMLSFLLLTAICILTPAVTAGAISGEREQLTYEMLLSTPLHPAKLIWGKLFSSLSYIFLLIFSAVPIASLIFVFGGVSLRDMVKSFTVLIAVTITLGVMGIFLSSIFKRTSRATVISYIILVLIIFGSILVTIAAGLIQQGVPPRWIIAVNPISALASALSNSSTQYNSALSFIPFLGVDLNMLGGETISFTSIPRPLYHFSLPLYGFITILLFFLSIRLIMPTKKWRITRKEILIFLICVFLLCAIVLIAFFVTTSKYEQAINPTAKNMGLTFPNAPFREPAIAIEPAIEVRVANTIDDDQLTLALEEQIQIFAIALGEVINTFTSDNKIKFDALFLVEYFVDTESNETYTYTIPDPIQLAISEQIIDLAEEIRWIATPKDVEPSASSNNLIITLGNLTSTQERSVQTRMTVYYPETEKMEYLLIFSDQGEFWELDSVEKIFNAHSTD